jgi:hypothetical protein
MEADPEAIAAQLREPAARATALDSLERHPAPIPTDVSLAVAPELGALLCADESDVDRTTFDRAGLLLGRLHAEALPGVAPVYGAGFGSGRYEAMLNANSVVNAALLRTPASDLTEADAISCACRNSIYPAMEARSWGPPRVAAGYDTKQWVGIFVSLEPLISQKLQPADDVPRRILTLTVELLKSNELSDLVCGGLWYTAGFCLLARPALGPVALECGIFEAAMAQLDAMGSPADYLVSGSLLTVFLPHMFLT